MHDLARQKLKEIVAQYGDAVINDPRRCRALLLDFCGEYRREIFVLVAAQEEQVADDLQEAVNSTGSVQLPLVVLFAQLTRRLVDNRAITEDAARWAVESWALALGMALPTTPDIPQVPHPPAPSPTERKAPERHPPKNQLFASRYKVTVFGKPRSDAGAKWQKLGETPGSIDVPAGYVLSLQPHNIGGEALLSWVQALDVPASITRLNLGNLVVTDAVLKALRALTHLTRLDIKHGAQITDAGLNHLRALDPLAHVDLMWATQITDAGLASLATLSHLAHLGLSSSGITDAGLAHLKALPNISSLDLRMCKQISDAGLAYMKVLSKLSSLDLTGCISISDAGLVHLADLRNLNRLLLASCPKITNRGVAHLRRLSNLSYLDLSTNHRISDRCLAHMRALGNLSSLNLSRTNVTDTGLVYLEALPGMIYLDLSWCDQVTNRGLQNLQRLPNLAFLNLVGCARVTPRGIAKLERPGLAILR